MGERRGRAISRLGVSLLDMGHIHGRVKLGGPMMRVSRFGSADRGVENSLQVSAHLCLQLSSPGNLALFSFIQVTGQVTYQRKQTV